LYRIFVLLVANIADRTQQMEQIRLTKVNSESVIVNLANLLKVGLCQNKGH